MSAPLLRGVGGGEGASIAPREAAPPGPRCVLDLEVAPDRHAHVLSGRRSVPRDTVLNEVVNASVLCFEELADGGFADFRLRSFARSEMEEADILRNVELELDRVRKGGRLVTFNGTAFDLPLLHARQMRWWLCEADAVRDFAAGRADHADLMLALSLDGRGRWPTLSDACAGFGFSLAGSTALPAGRIVPPEVRKCERDVVGTAILYFHHAASAARSLGPLREGLPALGRFLRGPGAGRPHLGRLAGSPLLADVAAPWS